MATKRMPAAVRPSSHFALIKCTAAAAWVVGVRRRLGTQPASTPLSGTEKAPSDVRPTVRGPRIAAAAEPIAASTPRERRETEKENHPLCDTHGGCCERERGLPRVQPPQHPACLETRAAPFSTQTTSTLRTTRDAWCKVKVKRGCFWNSRGCMGTNLSAYYSTRKYFSLDDISSLFDILHFKTSIILCSFRGENVAGDIFVKRFFDLCEHGWVGMEMALKFLEYLHELALVVAKLRDQSC